MEYIEEDVICWKGQQALYSFLWIFFSQDRTSGDLEIIFAFYTVFAGVAPDSGQGLSGGWESTFRALGGCCCLFLCQPSQAPGEGCMFYC